MIPYQAKSKKVSGTNYGEVMGNAFFIYDKIKKKTKRRPYIRSAYFKKKRYFLIISGNIFFRNLLKKE